MGLLKLSWRKFENLTDILCRKTGHESFDYIVCIATGGLILGKFLSEKLDLPLGIISMKAYDGRKLDKLIIDRHISSTKKPGGLVLLVDDIADSGTSFKAAYDYVSGLKGVRKVKTASLFNKPHSSFVPDYFVKETSKWVIFPYEKN